MVLPEVLRNVVILEHVRESKEICIRGKVMEYAGQFMQKKMHCQQ